MVRERGRAVEAAESRRPPWLPCYHRRPARAAASEVSMSAIRMNGQYVLTRDVEKKDFAAFMNLVLPKIGANRPIPHVAADMVAQLLSEGKTASDPVVQAGLQALATVGVKNFWVDGATASVVEETETDASLGREAAFGFAAINSGTAFLAAACNAFRRRIRVNDRELAVLRQPRDTMMKVAQAVSAMKGVNEPVFVTAGRYLGIRIKEGHPLEDPETMTALCMLSDLGATAVRIDVEKGELGFGPFDVSNAMASAIMQGLDAEKVANVRASVVRINDQFRRLSEGQAAAGQGSAGQGRPQGAQGGQPPQQTLNVPSVMGTRRRR